MAPAVPSLQLLGLILESMVTEENPPDLALSRWLFAAAWWAGGDGRVAASGTSSPHRLLLSRGRKFCVAQSETAMQTLFPNVSKTSLQKEILYGIRLRNQTQCLLSVHWASMVPGSHGFPDANENNRGLP